MKPSIGERSSIRPGSWTEAKAQNGSPGNLGDPAHVHVRASRQSGRRLNMDPGPEGPLRRKSRAGKNVVRQVTAKNRYARALAAVTAWCRRNRHQSIPDQSAHLTAMMRGDYAYYGITGNFPR